MVASVFFIEACDYENFPVGGQLSHAKHCIHAFGNRLALVGITTDQTPVGVWTKKEVDGVLLDFFSVHRFDPGVAKPWLPRRLSAFLALKRYRRQILSLGVKAAYVQAPEVLMAISSWGLRVCFSSPGVENPLAMSRYRLGRLLATPFDRVWLSTLSRNAEVILAAADEASIVAMAARSRGTLDRACIIPHPTRVDTDLFKFEDGIVREGGPRFISCGRLNRAKGWELVLEAFRSVKRRLPSAMLCFVGDGEDRPALEERIVEAGLTDSVVITGFIDQQTIASLLKRAHVFVLGSHREGWPTVVLEALACGLPVVTTDVSGARDMVIPGNNGYIVQSRDAEIFADCMSAALELANPNPESLKIAMHYSLGNLRGVLERLWEPFRGDAI